jgi:hypothetical protein
MLMPMVAKDADACWIHVAFEGAFEGHRDGPFEFTRDKFRSMVRNFKANPNAIPMDYLHSSENPDASEAPASGWVQKLEVRDDEDGKACLWAFGELTKKAASHIRDGEYRYCSGVFNFEAHDLASGEPIGCTMDSLALVNTPFMRGCEPIRLSHRQRSAPPGAEGNQDMFTKKQIRALMEVKVGSLVEALDQIEGETVTPEQLEAAASFAAAKDGMLEETADLDAAGAKHDDGATNDVASLAEDEEEDKAAMADGDPEEDDKAALAENVDEPEDDERPALAEDPEEAAALAELMSATGMDLPAIKAAISANLDAFVSLLTGALDTPAAPADLGPAGTQAFSLQLSTAQAQVTALSTHTAKLEAELVTHREAEADRLVKALADAGRIPVGMADKWRAVCLSDRATFDTLTASMPKVIPMGDHANAVIPPAKDAEPVIDEGEEFVKRTRLNLKHMDKTTQDKAIRRGLRALADRA